MLRNKLITNFSEFLFEDANQKRTKLPKEAYQDKYNWPYPPNNLQPLSIYDAERIYGKIEYKAKGRSGRVLITNNFYKDNIIETHIPQIQKIQRPYGTTRIHCHKLAEKQILGLWQEWENSGLLSRVITFNGCFNSRFERGSSTTLSNHAFGAAFDINADYNKLGQIPPAVGEIGSVRELVTIANKWGFFWGGHYKSRLDGMHFELANPYLKLK